MRVGFLFCGSVSLWLRLSCRIIGNRFLNSASPHGLEHTCHPLLTGPVKTQILRGPPGVCDSAVRQGLKTYISYKLQGNPGAGGWGSTLRNMALSQRFSTLAAHQDHLESFKNPSAQAVYTPLNPLNPTLRVEPRHWPF